MTILLPSRHIVQPGRQFELNTNVWEADGLVGLWPLGSYPDGRDMSLLGNHGTPTGGPVQSASGGRFGLELDGVDDYVNVPQTEDIVPGVKDWSFCFFIKHNGGTYYASHRVYGGDYAGWILAGTIPKLGIDFGTSYYEASAPSSLNSSSWHFVCSVLDRSNSAVVYVDGIAGTPVDISADVASDLQIVANLHVGSDWLEPPTSTSFAAALMDDIRIYNRALSPSEVSELYRTTRPGGYGRLAKPRVKYWFAPSGNWSWLHHLQNSPYGISQ